MQDQMSTGQFIYTIFEVILQLLQVENNFKMHFKKLPSS
jgi:hypothetical protein